MQRLQKNLKSPLSFHPIAIIFGLLSFVSYLVEGAVGDWSALYLFEIKVLLSKKPLWALCSLMELCVFGRLLGNTIGKTLNL